MGQKVNPFVFRLGNLFTWSSCWFADGKRYKKLLLEDIKLRKALQEKLERANLSRVEIQRSINQVKITLYVSRPGVVIGRGGTGLEGLKKFVMAFLKKSAGSNVLKIELRVEPVKEPNLDSKIVASTIAQQLSKRFPHKRAVKQAIERVMGSGAKAIKIILSGRIAGAEIARQEKFQEGSVPLSTLREEIDYACVPSLTKSGYIGVKIWICRKKST